MNYDFAIQQNSLFRASSSFELRSKNAKSAKNYLAGRFMLHRIRLLIIATSRAERNQRLCDFLMYEGFCSKTRRQLFLKESKQFTWSIYHYKIGRKLD